MSCYCCVTVMTNFINKAFQGREILFGLEGATNVSESEVEF